MLLVFAILLIIILVVLVRCIVIVPQSNAYVTEWLGVYKDTWESVAQRAGRGLPAAARHHPRQRHDDDRHRRFLSGV